MNAIAEYRQCLVESGLSESDAERVANYRTSKRASNRSGAIRAEKNSDGQAELLLYDVIGFDMWTGGGFTPKSLIEQLTAMQPFDSLTVRINSPGGDVFDGMTIYNILRRQEAKVSVEVEGLAASAASFIAQVADAGELRISEAGMFMVHRAWGLAMGNTNDMLQMADVLEKIDGQIADIYASRSGRKAATWLGMMDDETWLTGQEAVDAKLADKTVTLKRAAAMFDLGQFGYKNAPEAKQDDPIIVPLKKRDGVTVEDAVANAFREAYTGPNVTAVDVRLRLMELEGA
jgi:ATP-dependent protease ClpP protease subunit